MRFEASVNIKGSPEAIWEAVADPEAWPTWTNCLSEIRKLSKEPLGVGSKLDITLSILIPIRLHVTITGFIHGEQVMIAGKVLLGNMTRYYKLKPQEGYTRAIAGGEVDGPLSPLVRLLGQVISEKILRDLKIKMEG
jgi:hypothetical protein